VKVTQLFVEIMPTAEPEAHRRGSERMPCYPPALLVVYGLKMLYSYSYFSTSLNVTVYLTSLGWSDSDAGWAYGLVGLLTSLYGLVGGFVVDRLGCRGALSIGAALAAASRFVLLHSSKHTLWLSLFLLMPLGEALGIPVLTIAIKRILDSTPALDSGAAYDFFYVAMNVAALLAGLSTDLVRAWHQGSAEASRCLFLVGGMCNMVTLLFAHRLLASAPARTSGTNTGRFTVHGTLLPLLCERSFWRLLVCTTLLSGVKMVFRHLDATLPKYMLRTLGPDAPYGLIYSINPFLVITLLSLRHRHFTASAPRGTAASLDRHATIFRAIYGGSWVAAASPFVLCVRPALWPCALFVTVLSCGEVLYSPPTYEYSMALAPPGREGAYTSLASLPLYASKLLSGGMSGSLLERYCPAGAAQRPEIMWALIGLSALSSPILLSAFRPFVDPAHFRLPAHAKDHEMGPLLAGGGVSVDQA
jgi:MFS family permease